MGPLWSFLDIAKQLKPVRLSKVGKVTVVLGYGR